MNKYFQEGARVRFICSASATGHPTPGTLGWVWRNRGNKVLDVHWDDKSDGHLTIGQDQFLQVREMPDRGRVSPKYGHLGMWTLGLGPEGAIPSQRLELALIDDLGRIVRRFEQIRGACTDSGYVDFFNSMGCRPARHKYPLVDIGSKGRIESIVCEDFDPRKDMSVYLAWVKQWAEKHGNLAWHIPPGTVAKQLFVVQ